MSLVHRRGPVQARANLTPLIDVTFLLIVFFILVAQITKTQIVEEIDLPQPEHSVSVEPDEGTRLVLNVMPDESDRRKVVSYRLGSRDFAADADGLLALQAELMNARANNPQLRLDLRADRITSYGEIYPAMHTARAAGIVRVNLVVQLSMDEVSTTKGGG